MDKIRNCYSRNHINVRAEFTCSKQGPKFGEQFWIRRRGGLPSCTVRHEINSVYMQNIEENPCSPRYVDSNTSKLTRQALAVEIVTYEFRQLSFFINFSVMREVM